MEHYKNRKDSIIKVENLTKKFGNFIAVDNINFKVKRGEIFGFLGPNGAGKSTTIRMLSAFSGVAGYYGVVSFRSGHDINSHSSFPPDDDALKI